MPMTPQTILQRSLVCARLAPGRWSSARAGRTNLLLLWTLLKPPRLPRSQGNLPNLMCFLWLEGAVSVSIEGLTAIVFQMGV
jgi:hypothetical protein